MNQFFARATLAASIVCISGCATSTYRTPGAESAKASELAVLEYNGSLTVGGVNISEVDGRRRGNGFFRRFELTPGDHSIKAYLNLGGPIDSKSITLSFIAVAGEVYELKYEIVTTSAVYGPYGHREGTWTIWIANKGTGKILPSARL